MHHILSLDLPLSLLLHKSLPPQQLTQETFLGSTSLGSHLFPNRLFILHFPYCLVATFGVVQCYKHDQKQ